MSIFAGSTEVKSIKFGTTDVKAVYAGDTKVWPVGVPIPDAPNHNYAGRVIYSYGQPFDGNGQFYTERGSSATGCNIQTGDVHIMLCAHRGGVDPYANTWDFGYGLNDSHIFKGQDTYYADALKLSVGIHVANSNSTAPRHYMTDKANTSFYPFDFLAYAWVIPKEALGDPDAGSLQGVDASPTQPIVILDGIPNGIAIVACGAASLSSADYKNLTHKQSGQSNGRGFYLAGGYKYIRLDSNGQYREELDIDAVGECAERLFVYRRKA